MARNRVSPQQASDETWRVFRIMAEFVEGFDTLSDVGPAVSVFGSARTTPDNYYYGVAVELGRKLVEAGYSVITGGGPGMMEAANKGAKEAGGESIGLNIIIPHEQKPNPYLTLEIDFDYFFARKVMFLKYSVAMICMPGGFGTMDEYFETLTLIQTERTHPSPVVLIGTEFWQPLVDWIRDTLLNEYKAISPQDVDLYLVTDDLDEAVRHIVTRSEANKPLWDHPHRRTRSRRTRNHT